MSNPSTASGAVLTHIAAPGQGYELDGTIFVGDFSDVTQDITAVFDFWNGGRLDVSLADGTVIFQDLVEALDLTAGSGNDSVFAYVYDDTIYGGLGDDTVLGDAGDDVLAGGDGDDLLDAGEGTDTVFGGAGDDVLAWNRSFSGLGHFDGGDGLDTLTYQGGEIRGTFTNFEVLNGAGSSIQATVAALNSFSTLQVSVVSLLDGGVIDFSGRTLGGIQVYGYSGGAGLTITTGDGNDVIYGGSGSDSLYGAGGNDSLALDAAYEEFDTDVDYLYGGDGNDTLDYGNYNQGGDVFDGGAGTDILSYSSGQLRGTFTGVEILEAGGEIAAAPEALANFDVINAYLVKLVSGGAIDASAKAGTIDASAKAGTIHDIWSLTAENVTVIGTAGDNAITGSGGNDVLNGGDGHDGLVGRSGFLAVGPYSDSNLLNGDAGNDSLEGSGGHDTLNGGTGDDFISSSSVTSLLEFDQYQGGVDIIDGGAGWDMLYFYRLYTTQGRVYDFAQGGTAAGFTAADGTTFRNIEQVELWAGEGNDQIIGGLGNDELYGWLGADTMKGGGGDDSLYGTEGDDLMSGGVGNDEIYGAEGRDTLSYADAAAGVTVSLAIIFAGQATGAAGNDSIYGFEDLIGSGFGDKLTGDGGHNLIDGGAGGDRMVGGVGDDTYYVDNAADSVGENHLEGNDTIISSVTYTLAGRAVEVLTLTGSANLGGTGNSLNNTLNGNFGNNTLDGGAGNDVLNGGTGADRMLGGLGDDTYYVDSLSDSVGENHLEGTDTIITAMSYSLFGRAVEVLTMTGSANLTAVGNSLNNTLNGNAGNNVLDGGTGADKMVGGVGDDTYYVDHVQDNVFEQHLQGTDTVYASVSYSFFGRAAEILTLTGAGNINGTGNSLFNSLTGNGGNNTLDGAGGNDLLSGGLGSDVFLFGLGSGKDTITDFSAAQNDIVNIHAFTNGAVNAGLVSQSGADVLITLGGGNMVTVENATRADVLAHIVW